MKLQLHRRLRAQVRLDADFAATVHTDDYHVFLTEYDDNNGLYVTERSATRFTVRAKASNTASGTFSYRVVARRSDIEAPRTTNHEAPGPCPGVGRRLCQLTATTFHYEEPH